MDPLARTASPADELGPLSARLSHLHAAAVTAEPVGVVICLVSPGSARQDLRYLDHCTCEHRVARLSEPRGQFPGQKPNSALLQGHEQVPALLHGPGITWLRSHVEDIDVASADFDHEEHILWPATAGTPGLWDAACMGSHGRVRIR